MSEHLLLPHQSPVRFSRLKLMGVSPQHYRASFDIGTPDTQQKRFGRLVHAVALGGKVAVFDGERRGKRWLQFKLDNQGAELALEDEYKEALRIAFALEAHPLARPLLRGDREKEIAWMLDGRACGARLDVIGDGFVCDLKTTARAEPHWFMRNAERMGYHAQLAWYRMGASLALGTPFQWAFVVAVEPRFPYAISCFELTLGALDNGERLWRSWWEKLRVCEQTATWPGYSQSMVEWNVDADVEIDYGD